MYDNVKKINSYPNLQASYSHIMKDLAFLVCYAIELYNNVSISSIVTKQVNMNSSGKIKGQKVVFFFSSYSQSHLSSIDSLFSEYVFLNISFKAQSTGSIFHTFYEIDVGLKQSVS